MSFSDDLLREIKAAEPKIAAAAAAPNPSEQEQADAIRRRIVELRPRWEEQATQFAEAMAQIGVKPPPGVYQRDGRQLAAEAWYLRESVVVLADGRLRRLKESWEDSDVPILSGDLTATLRENVDVCREPNANRYKTFYKTSVLELCPAGPKPHIGSNDGCWQSETLGITSDGELVFIKYLKDAVPRGPWDVETLQCVLLGTVREALRSQEKSARGGDDPLRTHGVSVSPRISTDGHIV